MSELFVESVRHEDDDNLKCLKLNVAFCIAFESWANYSLCMSGSDASRLTKSSYPTIPSGRFFVYTHSDGNVYDIFFYANAFVFTVWLHQSDCCGTDCDYYECNDNGVTMRRQARDMRIKQSHLEFTKANLKRVEDLSEDTTSHEDYVDIHNEIFKSDVKFQDAFDKWVHYRITTKDSRNDFVYTDHDGNVYHVKYNSRDTVPDEICYFQYNSPSHAMYYISYNLQTRKFGEFR